MNETLKLKDLSFEAMCAIIAQVVQAANRQYVEAIGGRAVNPGWEQLPEEQKQSLMKAIRTTVMTPKTLEQSHEDWCLAREAQGYTRGNYVDHVRKTHPNLVRFNELPFEEQFKDALFLGITSIFASALGLGEPPEEYLPAGEGDGDLIDEIDEYTEGPGTVGEAAEAVQEKLDTMNGVTTPIDGYDPDSSPPEDVQDPDTVKNDPSEANNEALENAVGRESLDVDLIEAHNTKLAATPENVLDPDDLQNPEHVQALDPKPNLPDEDLDPVDHKATKEKQDTPAKRAKKAKKK